MKNGFMRFGFLFLILFFYMPSITFGINTMDWEGILAVQLFGAKPEKEWLLRTTQVILAEAFPKKNKEYFEKYYDKKSNSINIPFQKGWHDLTEFKISYFDSDKGGHIYAVWYKFKKGSITLLDVLERYGHELAIIKTKEDLSKEIQYVLKTDLPSLVGKNPLWPLAPVNQGQVTILKFASKDKVFVDDLIIFSHKPENN